MNMINFIDYAELGEDIVNIANSGKSICVVTFKNGVIKLLKWLMEYDNVYLGHIDIKDEYFEEYTGEYYIKLDEDITSDEKLLVLDIEPAFDDNTGEIQECFSDIMYYDGDTNSRIVISQDSCIQKEIFISEDDRLDDECGECCYDCCKCPKEKNNESISHILDLLDYIEKYLDK